MLGSVNCDDPFTTNRDVYPEPARHLIGVERVKRPIAVVGYVVGDVHKSGNRSEANRSKPILHPFRRLAVPYVPDCAAEECRATDSFRVIVDPDRHRAREVPLHWFDRCRDDPAQIPCGKIAGNSGNPKPIRPIGRDRNFDNRVVKSGILRKTGAKGCVRWEFDYSVMLVGNHQFPFRAKHAVAFHTPDHSHLEVHAGSRNVGSCRGENTHKPGFGVGGTTNDLNLPAVAARPVGKCLKPANPQPVGIRMWRCFYYPAHGEGFQGSRRIPDALHFEAQIGQCFTDLVKSGFGVEMIFEPGKGEFHVGGSLWPIGAVPHIRTVADEKGANHTQWQTDDLQLCLVTAIASGEQMLVKSKRDSQAGPVRSPRYSDLSRGL